MAQAQTPALKADILFIHADVYTGARHDAKYDSLERAEAIAVRGERILAVGTSRDLEKLKGPRTQVIDLGGHFVMPGFNDAHVHLMDAGLQKLNVDLTGVKTLQEFRQRVRARAEKAKPGEWIFGGGWDETLWPAKELPNRWDLDEVAAGHPVYLERTDGHIAVANTRALQLGNVSAASRDPLGGKIDRNESGEPTGILRETGKAAVQRIVPAPSREKRRQGIELALEDFAEHGVTSVQDASPWEDFEIYAQMEKEGKLTFREDFQIFEELEKEGKLTARISEWLPFDASLAELRTIDKTHAKNDRMLHFGMLKGFIDGALGSRTAALLAPYADDAGNSGSLRYDAAKLNEMTRERLLAGFQIGFHAIGDRGIQMALDAFAEAETAVRSRGVKAENGGDDFRLRIEHSQVTTPEEIEEYKKLGVIASMQPSHILNDMRWAQARLGAKRSATSYAWASFLKAGNPLAFGTDYPVEAITPFRGLYAAVTRASEDGNQKFFPEQKLTIDQAIAAYTSGSAFAEFEEKEKGELVPGMLADFVVLDRDITGTLPLKILETVVLRTVVGGKTVYERK